MAQSDETFRRTVTVQGTGTVDIAPDQATVRFGVETRAKTPDEARSDNASAAAATMRAARALDIEERHIEVRTLRLEEDRSYDSKTRTWIMHGYKATRTIQVLVEDLDQLPVLVARVVEQGANRLDDLTYGRKDSEAQEQEALRKALLHARDKADLMASTLGASVGEVQTIVDENVQYQEPWLHAESMSKLSADASASMPEPEAFAGGQLQFTASVRVVFALR